METSCLFCRAHGPFTTIEHIVRQSLGNDDDLLKGEVCDDCQAYFGKEIEKFVLSRTPFAFWRTLLGLRTTTKKLPSVDLSQPRQNKGRLPELSVHHDDHIGLTAHEDGSTSVDIDDPRIVTEIVSGRRSSFQFVLSPKHLCFIGRFLGKIGLEFLCRKDPEQARSAMFDDLRQYIREGIQKEIWPLFHATKGRLEELRAYHKREGEWCETVLCYEHSIRQAYEAYWLFSLRVGTDVWAICMNDRYPPTCHKECLS